MQFENVVGKEINYLYVNQLGIGKDYGNCYYYSICINKIINQENNKRKYYILLLF